MSDMLPALQIIGQAIHSMDGEFEETYIIKSVQYLMKVGEISDHQAYTKTITQSLGHVEEEKIMTIAEKLRQEGRQEGRLEGESVGFQKALKQTRQEREQEHRRLVRKLSARGMTVDMIVDITGLTTETVQLLLDDGSASV